MGGGAFPSYDPSMWSESMQSLQKLEPGVAPPEGNRKRAAFLTGMLQTISDKVAGGTRDPSVYQQYGMTDSEEQERQVETP